MNVTGIISEVVSIKVEARVNEECGIRWINLDVDGVVLILPGSGREAAAFAERLADDLRKAANETRQPLTIWPTATEMGETPACCHAAAVITDDDIPF